MIKVNQNDIEANGKKDEIMAEIAIIVYSMLAKKVLTKGEIAACFQVALEEINDSQNKPKVKKIFDDGGKAMSVVEISTKNKSKDEIASEIANIIKEIMEQEEDTDEDDDT